jgi:hypothetical protein
LADWERVPIIMNRLSGVLAGLVAPNLSQGYPHLASLPSQHAGREGGGRMKIWMPAIVPGKSGTGITAER